MLIHKGMLAVLTVVSLSTVSVYGASIVSAQTPSANSFPNLVQKIADRFHLKETDVKAVFDENRKERLNKFKTNFELKLNQAVSAGKITESQKLAILNKFSEPKAGFPNFESFKNMTPDQRKQAMEIKHTEIENWAKENGLTLETLHDVMGFRGRGFKMRFKN